MAVDLEELVPSLRRQVSPPGTELLGDLRDADLVGYLSDAFWIGKLDGFFANYTEEEGVVEPLSLTQPDLPRDWQQLLVLYASMQIVENQLRNTNTVFRTKAGPVEYETQSSAQLLREHLVALLARRAYLLELLSQRYSISAGYVDMVRARTAAISDGYNSFDSGVSRNRELGW